MGYGAGLLGIVAIKVLASTLAADVPSRERFEREYLSVQIMRFGGNISRTAHFIGMERSALHRKLKSLGVEAPGRPGEVE
jgi:DNA-binding NtrC family response regulator